MEENSSLAFFEIQKLPTFVNAFSISALLLSSLRLLLCFRESQRKSRAQLAAQQCSAMTAEQERAEKRWTAAAEKGLHGKADGRRTGAAFSLMQSYAVHVSRGVIVRTSFAAGICACCHRIKLEISVQRVVRWLRSYPSLRARSEAWDET
ncbi:hypothetical protein ACLOJK_038418, partial [Asimina triloba]